MFESLEILIFILKKKKKCLPLYYQKLEFVYYCTIRSFLFDEFWSISYDCQNILFSNFIFPVLKVILNYLIPNFKKSMCVYESNFDLAFPKMAEPIWNFSGLALIKMIVRTVFLELSEMFKILLTFSHLKTLRKIWAGNRAD